MRITNGMMSKNLLNNLQLNMKRMSKLNQQAASGKLFDNPSDAPVAMAKSLKLYTDVSKVHQYERNLRDAQSWLSTTEDALHEMGEIFQRTRELAVDMANGTKTESDTQKAAAEIAQLKDQMIKLANTTHAGRSIFTGYQTDKELLNKDGTYKIDLNQKTDVNGNRVNEVSVYNVGVAENMDINILGSKIFGVKNETELEFKNIDGKNTLTIDLGEDNSKIGDLEVEVIRGNDTDPNKASWSGNKLTITLNTSGTIKDTDIKTLIQGATGDLPEKDSETFDSADVSVSIDGPIGSLTAGSLSTTGLPDTVTTASGIATFTNRIGADDLVINLGGITTPPDPTIEIKVGVAGSVDGAEWNGGNLTITLSPGNKSTGEIADIIKNAGVTSGSLPTGYSPDEVSVSTVEETASGVAIFEELDGKDDLAIDIGFDGVNISILEGDTDSAEWDSGNLTITFSPGNKTAKEIEQLIKAADSTNAPLTYNSSDVSVTTANRLDGASIKNSELSTRRANASDIKEGQKSHLIDVFDQLISAMGVDVDGTVAEFDQEEVSNLIGDIDIVMENALTLRAGVGAKTNRLEMTSKRLSSEELNFTSVLSENEDVDEAEIIMKFKMAEAVYNASLSMGGRTIQPTLVDFLR